MKQIAIAGLGVVGGGVADLLVNHAAVIEKNAGEEVRQAADDVTDDVDHDGIQNALRRFGVI